MKGFSKMIRNIGVLIAASLVFAALLALVPLSASPAGQKGNEAKVKLLYETIDGSSGYYHCPVEKASRSLMNVVFRVAGGDEAVEKEFAKGAAAASLVGTPGHRSVGGMRISLYNAVGLDAVEALVAFMREFQRTRG